MDLSMFSNMFSGLADTGSNLVIVIVAIVILFGFIGAIWFLVKEQTKYKQYSIIVWEKDGFGQLTHAYDGGGIFVDKNTGNKRLFLKNNRVGLEPDNIPFIMMPNGQKVVIVLKSGLKNFSYVKPTITNNLIKFTVGEEDVNWAINSYDSIKKKFANNLLKEYLPFIMIAIAFAVLLILFNMMFKKMDVLVDVAQALERTANTLAAMNSGTTVIQ